MMLPIIAPSGRATGARGWVDLESGRVDCRVVVSLISSVAPAARSTRTHPARPASAEMRRAVLPLVLAMLTSACAARRSSMHDTCPW